MIKTTATKGPQMIDAHALMSTINMTNLLKSGKSRNIQINDLIKAMAESEPCLFNNSEDNLMPVTETILDIAKIK